MILYHTATYEEHSVLNGEKALDWTGMVIYGSCALSFILFLILLDVFLGRYLRGDPLCHVRKDGDDDDDYIDDTPDVGDKEVVTGHESVNNGKANTDDD